MLGGVREQSQPPRSDRGELGVVETSEKESAAERVLEDVAKLLRHERVKNEAAIKALNDRGEGLRRAEEVVEGQLAIAERARRSGIPLYAEEKLR